MREAVRDSVRGLHQAHRGSVSGGTFDEFRHVMLQTGGWWDLKETVKATPSPPRLSRREDPELSGSSKDYPFFLVPFESHALGAGEHAHLPWLQATPDPMTSAVWQTWVELNPKTAKQLHLRDEDAVTVESPTGASVEALVYVNPAAPPDVLAVPLGQGHTQHSTFAAGRGDNPLRILDTLQDTETGALAWAATRVRLIKTGRRRKLPKFEGTVPSYQAPDERIIQITRSS